MDKNIQELLLSIARNLENASNDPAMSYLTQGYLLLIAQDIYTYLDTLEDD